MRWFFSVALACAAGCGGASEPPPIYIGQVSASGGASRDLDAQATLGIRLAVQGIRGDSAASQDRPIDVIHSDTSGQLDAIGGTAVRLVKINRVVALYGGRNAEELERLERGHAVVPVVSPASVMPRDLGEASFSIGLAPDVIGKALAEVATEQAPNAGVVIVRDKRISNGPAIVESFERELHARGKKAKTTLAFDKDSKMKEVAQSVATEMAEAALFIGEAGDFREFTRELPAPRPLLLFGGPDGALPEVEVESGVVVVTAFAPDPELPRTLEFAKKFREAFAREADAQAALAYDGTRILAEAIRNVAQGESLLEELKKTKDFPGLTGPVSFTSERILRRPAFIVRLDGNKATLLKRVAP